MAANYDSEKKDNENQFRLPANQRMRNGLHPLPLAHKEVQHLAKEFRGYFGFDSLATERIFKQKATNFGIIHLAMHGMIHPQSANLSSLVFTEDGDSIENNILHAYELSKLDLQAKLVVLSACETGFGKFEDGNGVASIARAFMYAGVPSIVASLWKVDDRATSQIMKTFYRYLAKGENKAQALRLAKLDYLKNADNIMAHPAYWSAFVQIGNSKSITIQRKMYAHFSWVHGLIIIGIIIVLCYIWYKKRTITKYNDI